MLREAKLSACGGVGRQARNAPQQKLTTIAYLPGVSNKTLASYLPSSWLSCWLIMYGSLVASLLGPSTAVSRSPFPLPGTAHYIPSGLEFRRMLQLRTEDMARTTTVRTSALRRVWRAVVWRGVYLGWVWRQLGIMACGARHGAEGLVAAGPHHLFIWSPSCKAIGTPLNPRGQRCELDMPQDYSTPRCRWRAGRGRKTCLR